MVEMMVVVVVMGILSFLAVKAFSGDRQRNATDALVRIVARTLMEGHSYAVSRGRRVLFVYNPPFRSLNVVVWNDGAGGGIPNNSLEWFDMNGDGFLNPGEGEVVELIRGVSGEREVGVLYRGEEVEICGPTYNPCGLSVGSVGCLGSNGPVPDLSVAILPSGRVTTLAGDPCLEYRLGIRHAKNPALVAYVGIVGGGVKVGYRY